MKTQHLLFDIEGTTCPVSFVSEILFPYARESLGAFISKHQSDQDIRTIIRAAADEWVQDNNKTSKELLKSHHSTGLVTPEAITQYLLHLISIDRKSTALKDLQGKIWDNGYRNGDLNATLFPEVSACFQQWSEAKILISSYSSGSIQAQKLIYQFSDQGNLSQYIHQWFDTHTGAKKSSDSYTTISALLGSTPTAILFVSDNSDECDAAHQAGMKTLFSRRSGNPDQDSGGHTTITSLLEISRFLNS